MCVDLGSPSSDEPRSWRPTGLQTLLLRACLLDGEPARSALERWTELSDFENLDGGSYRLLPLLYRSLDRRGIEHFELARLRGTYRRAWYANVLTVRFGQKVIKQLADEGIATIVLKGGALQQLVYADPPSRPLADLDILVHLDDAQRASDILTEAGLTTPAKREFGPQSAAPYAAMGYYGALHESVDLHWRVNYYTSDPTYEDRAWSRSLPITLGDVATRTLDHTDHLLHAFTHGIAWAETPPCRWAADAYLLITHPEGIDWPRFLDDATRIGHVVECRLGLDFLVHELDAPVPSWVIDALAAANVTARERVRTWLRQSPPSRRTLATRLVLDYLYRSDGKPLATRIAGFVPYVRVTAGRDGTLANLVRVLRTGNREAQT